MIFISHTRADKLVVQPIAERLAAVFGQDKVFYDSWSIQPGDGIIERMNKGLEQCKFFFFFVSKKSLSNEMVKLEWQNAILKATKGETRFIPVRLDDVMLPQVLLQTVYIDLYGHGIETAIRQMIDVASGRNVYRGPEAGYHNVRAHVSKDGRALIVECRAESYLEPMSRYLFLVENQENEVSNKCLSDGMFMGGFDKVTLDDGRAFNAFAMSVDRGTAPGFPFVVKLEPRKPAEVKLVGVMRALKQDRYGFIPTITPA